MSSRSRVEASLEVRDVPFQVAFTHRLRFTDAVLGADVGHGGDHPVYRFAVQSGVGDL